MKRKSEIGKKVMHSWIEIDKTAFESNATLYRSIIGDEKSLAIVLKSNAYGHGLKVMGELAQENSNIQLLMVAYLHEAIALRKNGISKPILILNPVRSDLEDIINYNVSIMLTDLDLLPELNSIARKHATHLHVHVKIDTGLSRFGFPAETIIETLKTIVSYKHIAIEGLYTHFAESNSADLTYTHQQNDLFSSIIDQCLKAGFHIPYFHNSNTAGTTSIAHHPAINLFRLGAGFYGLEPSPAAANTNWLPSTTQRPVALLTWKTRICHIKTISANIPVGYNRTWTTPRATKIGIIPVGYYDGLNKALSNKAVVKIKNHYAPIVGLISMNAAMIDITDIPHAALDGEVILLSPDSQISAQTHALLTGCNNPRQITCGINSEINRIIV